MIGGPRRGGPPARRAPSGGDAPRLPPVTARPPFRLRWLLCTAILLAALGMLSTARPANRAAADAPSLLANGAFEREDAATGRPEGWETAGRPRVVQRLTVVRDARRGKVARLACTQFEPGFPDSHAMLAQVGQV